MYKKIINFTAVCLLSLHFSQAYSLSKTVKLGGESGWDNLAYAIDVVKGKGRFGYDCIELSTDIPAVTSKTDAQITFDGPIIYDSTGHYEISQNTLLLTKNAVKGQGAAMSSGLEKGLLLKGNSDALFGHSGLTGSFSIEFWLCPSVAENGEVIWSWRSSINDSSFSQYQRITASFINNHLEWKFDNIFIGYKDSEITLSGFTNIIPEKWSRHTLSYDQETGLLEYLVDGRTESVKYITSTGHQWGNVCYPVLGVKAGIEICPQYIGKIDNIHIERSPHMEKTSKLYSTGNETYKIDGGSFAIQPVRIAQASIINKVDVIANVPEQTAIRLYIRSGDNQYEWNDFYPEWKKLNPGEEIHGVSGQYFQIAAQLLPDGKCEVSPSITEICVSYTEPPEPLPPFTLAAQSLDEAIKLTWSYSVDDTAGGYYVYYGTHSGEYLGRFAVEGDSPVDVGNTSSCIISGLQNGTMYYFAIAAYSRYDKTLTGNLSKEVFARPATEATANIMDRK